MEEIEEVWKECGESSQKKYEVSNLGRVKSITKVNKIERFLKGYPDKDGYIRVHISKKPKFIHVLVALAFLGPKPDGLVVDHFDRCKTNNKINNLRYCTQSQNQINSDNYRDDILEQGVERLKVFRKEYYEDNREAILEKTKEKITCSCGSIFQKNSKCYHERSQTHKAYLENLNK
jgi:hypothetical protein